MQDHLRYRYPWRTGNALRLLPDGDAFFPRMLQAIDAAQRYVLMEMYLFESGVVALHCMDALIAAVARGARVHMVLDHFGSYALSAFDRQRLAAGGVQVLYYNPLSLGKWFNNLARDHRKLLLVDGEIAFVGGVGITDEFNPPNHPDRRWRETMVEVHGPVVADWQHLFVATWNQHAATPLHLPPGPPPAPADGVRTRVIVSAGPLRQENKRSLINDIRAARQRVWIATAYFLPGWRVLRKLRAAARRGIDVRLLLAGPLTDHPGVRLAGRRYYTRLLRSGVRIFEYQPRVLHSKVTLCDQRVSVGSSNYDRWNLRWNLEANLLVHDAAFAAQVQAMFEVDFRVSREVRYAVWIRRPRWVRLWERVWGSVDLFLHRLGGGRRGE
jgi:phosphatidylserine/phosphatidylglycerophosphate/cardiolipin synthase-like enzyme